MPAIRLKPARTKSVRNLHPWIFSGAIADVQGSPQPGSTVDVLSSEGDFLARGYYNARSQIRVRILTWDEDEEIVSAFWRTRLQRAIARRKALADDPQTTAYRLAFAESDGLPGLIVDVYGDWLVLQSLTAGIELWKPTLVELLMELLEPRGIYERSDADVRAREGLPSVTGCLAGNALEGEITILENGLPFRVDLRHGQKTGFYLDQRESRCKIGRCCRGREVLDAFCYTGGFGVYALSHGAKSVTSLDASARALQMAADNVHLNGLHGRSEYIEGNAFQVLRGLCDQGRQFDAVILDPPRFAFSRAQVTRATRGYKDINMLGMSLLRPGGLLCTFSCSGLVSPDLFQKVLFGASLDVGRQVRIIERLAQASDHPVLLTFPESGYLKGVVCLVE
ncbi:MAG TPA: class I SAM-dependent rRNA methyltransferase [Anaerolineae bacterium]|nr:class I SAM-dependent rRNA methyltransferase [Anaerolineae bacterium]